MSHELKEGAQLKSVFGPAPMEIYCEIGHAPIQAKEIVVSMQPGQMGMVPWAKATLNNGKVRLLNLALMEEVVPLEDE